MSNYQPLDTRFVIDDSPIPQVDTIKHLGVQLTPKLNFDAHFTTISTIYKQRVNLLCYMGKYLDAPTIMLLYKSYVRPMVEYAIPVWCFRLTNTQLSSLDILQARVCRRFLKRKSIPFDSHETKENLNKLCLLQSLHFRRQFLSLVVLFKFIHDFPHYLSRFNITISKSSRRPNKLVFNSHGTLLSSLFMHKIGTLWNCLPPHITSLKSIGEFKQQVRAHLFNYQFDCRGIH